MVAQSFSSPLGFSAQSAPSKDKSGETPAPAETETGGQEDDNVDDLGRRSDGKEIDQPVNPDKDEPRKGLNRRSKRPVTLQFGHRRICHMDREADRRYSRPAYQSVAGCGAMTDFSRARRAMIDSQLRTSSVTDRRILGVMGEVPREDFVEPDRRDVAYIDDVQRLGDKASGRFMSPPATFARLVQLAEVTSSDTVLDLGAGTGYSTAVLAGLAAEVTGLEADAELARRGSDILARQGVTNARIVAGEATALRGRRFDVIVVEGALDREPTDLFPCSRMAVAS